MAKDEIKTPKKAYKQLQAHGNTKTVRVTLDAYNEHYLDELHKIYRGLGTKCSDSVVLRKALQLLYLSERRQLRKAAKSDNPALILRNMKTHLKSAAGKDDFEFDRDYTQEELEKALINLGAKKPFYLKKAPVIPFDKNAKKDSE